MGVSVLGVTELGLHFHHKPLLRREIRILAPVRVRGVPRVLHKVRDQVEYQTWFFNVNLHWFDIYEAAHCCCAKLLLLLSLKQGSRSVASMTAIMRSHKHTYEKRDSNYEIKLQSLT